jgi:hypothetical protein
LKRTTILAALVFCAGLAAAPRMAGAGDAAGKAQYFYRGLSYGSDATFHPASELLNGAFGILQISSNWASLDEIDFERGLDVTWESITHPVRTVDAHGRDDFFANEVFPFKYGWRNLQWVPNYSLHLIGGGARHRAFIEWYGAHGFPRPTLWAWGTTVVHSFAVEAVEAHGFERPTVDPVSDMLIFDPLGALLFQNDRVSSFFASTLHMSIWSAQPMYNPVANTFENVGQNYGLHYFFSDNHRVGFFSYWGMSHLVGVTVRGKQGLAWSVGLGGAVDELREDESEARRLYARIKLDGGLFVHRNGSLLASLHLSQAWTQRFRLNVYPSWIRTGGMGTSIFTGVRGDDVILGVSISALPVGVAVSQ